MIGIEGMIEVVLTTDETKNIKVQKEEETGLILNLEEVHLPAKVEILPRVHPGHRDEINFKIHGKRYLLVFLIFF